ncbi:hypothetical protein [Culturomica massiliensis]|uniref:hypothetical protein n=1 Tax=Culturomica massiliensis TaxID=1841857 RepID=UPI003AB2F160
MKKVSRREKSEEKKFFSLNGDKIKESSKIFGGENEEGDKDFNTNDPSASTDRLCQGGCGRIAPF